MKKYLFMLVSLSLVLLLVISSAGCLSSAGTSDPYSKVPEVVELGDSYTVQSMDSENHSIRTNCTYVINQVIIGSQAEEIIKAGSTWNNLPTGNDVAILINMSETYESGTYSSVNTVPTYFRVYVNGTSYPAQNLGLPGGDYHVFPKTTILKGTTLTGWLYFIAPEGNAVLSRELDDGPAMFMKLNY
jgi:hypothetical protein